MDNELDTKNYWKGVKSRRDVKVAQGMDKNQAFKEALKEFNAKIFAIVDFASNYIRPVS